MQKHTFCLIFCLFWIPQLAFGQTDVCDHDLIDSCNYSPQDPWQRPIAWLRQTGHIGLFYNCDCEEEKRDSPYICWKSETGGCLRIVDAIHDDWRRMKQRIHDGTCECTGRLLRKQPNRSQHCQPLVRSNLQSNRCNQTEATVTTTASKPEESHRVAKNGAKPSAMPDPDR